MPTLFYSGIALIISAVTVTVTMAVKLPSQDPTSRSFSDKLEPHTVHKNSAGFFFDVWDRALETGAVATDPGDESEFTVFTLGHDRFHFMLPMDVINPFVVDKELQLKTLTGQIVVGQNVAPEDEKFAAKSELKNLAGDAIKLGKKLDGS